MDFFKDLKNNRTKQFGIACTALAVVAVSMGLYRQFHRPKTTAVYVNPQGQIEHLSMPSVITMPATDVTSSEATINAMLLSAGGAPTNTGFVYEGSPVDAATLADGGRFNVHLTKLLCDTTYSFNATASNVVGKIDGATRIFVTLPCGKTPASAPASTPSAASTKKAK